MPNPNNDSVVNEISSRSRNEWIEKMCLSFGAGVRMDKYVCECSYGGCTSTLDLTHEEYEAVRNDGMRFAIAINHEDPETDRVVAENYRYAIVEKWQGDARRVANDTNPRRPPLPQDKASRG